MATLSITIGAATASVTAPNAVAQALVEQVITHRGGPGAGTANERLQWLLRDTVRRWREETDDLAIRDALSAERDGSRTNGGR